MKDLAYDIFRSVPIIFRNPGPSSLAQVAIGKTYHDREPTQEPIDAGLAELELS